MNHSMTPLVPEGDHTASKYAIYALLLVSPSERWNQLLSMLGTGTVGFFS